MHQLLTIEDAYRRNLWVEALDRHEFLADSITKAIRKAIIETNADLKSYEELRTTSVENRLGLAAAVITLLKSEDLETFIDELRWIADSNGWEYV